MNILITGAGSVMGQSIYKALAQADLPEQLNIHFGNSDTLGAGRYFSLKNAPVVATPILPLATDLNYEKVLEEYIVENDIAIVFSGTQHELAKISKYRDRTFAAATIPSAIAEICMDKVKTSNILKKHGIRTPATYSLLQYLSAESELSGPIILKPNHSSSSRSIYRAQNRSVLEGLVLTESINPEKFLVQELLTGDEYTCGCYIDRYAKNINTIIFKRTLTPDGATFYGEIVENKEIENYIIQVGEALVLEGLDFGHINIQLILTESGPALFEINGRLSSTEASKAHYGFNSCAAFVSNVVCKEAYSGWNVSRKGRFLRFYEEVYFD